MNEIKVEVLDVMGNDLSVVNAARVSYEVWHEQFEKNDAGLINYLARHNHWTPFGHNSVTFRINAPIIVARQLVKHTVGLVWNEVSRRYVDSEPTFYMPDNWRARGGDSKQGSSQTEFIDSITEEGKYTTVRHPNNVVFEAYEKCHKVYRELLAAGVAPEQARMVLPQSMMTQWVWTGNVASFSRVCSLRCKPDTQKETRDVANMINNEMRVLFPISWQALHDSE